MWPMTEGGADAQALPTNRQQIQVNPENEKRGAVFIRIMRCPFAQKRPSLLTYRRTERLTSGFAQHTVITTKST